MGENSYPKLVTYRLTEGFQVVKDNVITHTFHKDDMVFVLVDQIPSQIVSSPSATASSPSYEYTYTIIGYKKPNELAEDINPNIYIKYATFLALQNASTIKSTTYYQRENPPPCVSSSRYKVSSAAHTQIIQFRL